MNERLTSTRKKDKAGCAKLVVELAALASIIGLTIANAGVGIGITARVPFTDSNITFDFAGGHKNKVEGALPLYTKDKLAGNENFVNTTQTGTFGPFEGIGQLVIGEQEGAPAIGVHFKLNH
jgi:hypothetical protein